MINREQAIDIIKAERECVYRQGRTGECCRDDLGCGACDLVMEDKDIIEAYDMAIKALKEETICPILSDDEVKQPCIKSPCGFERVNGDCRDRLKEVFREASETGGDLFHLSQIERIIDGEDWL